MSAITITPACLSGKVEIPPSKSLLHRGLVCAALAGDIDLCELPADGLISEDVRATQTCLREMSEAEKQKRPANLFCGESGTTLRLIVPLLAVRGQDAHIGGAGRLPYRPLAEYAEAFKDRGVQITFPDNGTFLPLHICGSLAPGHFTIPGNISSQYISGLLLALPLLGGDSNINLTSSLESEPYVNMTLDVMRHFGVDAHRIADGYQIPGGQKYHAITHYIPEPDFSQAAFWLLAAYLGNDVAMQTLPRQTSQGDSVFARMIETLRAAEPGDMSQIDVSQTPDLVPALAAAAAISKGETHIVNAARLRLKESDRLATTQNMLRAFGIHAESTPDGLNIQGSTETLQACTVDGSRDHRIVMTAAMLATRANGPVVITDSRAVDKSYPTFFNDYSHVGGIAHELNMGK